MRRLVLTLVATMAIAAANWIPARAQVNIAWLLDKRSPADVSSWADQNLDGNAQTALWHYVNIPSDAMSYDRDRDCPLQPGVAAGSRNDRWRDCVVDRILYSQDRLANTTLDRADRAVAFKSPPELAQLIAQQDRRAAGGSSSVPNVIVSPSVIASAVATGTHTGARLDLLVLWRGSPAWFMKGSGQRSSGGGNECTVRVSLSRGDLTFSLALDRTTRVLEIQGKTVSMGQDNVVFVDKVDSPEGPQVVKTLTIDPVLTEPLIRIQSVLRRSPEILSFLQCDVRVADPKQQGYFDQLCAPFTRK